MKVSSFYIIILTFIVLIFGTHSSCNELSSISIKEISMNKQKSTSLEGPWFFYWNTWVRPESVKDTFKKNKGTKVLIPFSWTNLNKKKSLKEEISPQGMASLIAEIKDVPKGQEISLFIKGNNVFMFLIVSLFCNINACSCIFYIFSGTD